MPLRLRPLPTEPLCLPPHWRTSNNYMNIFFKQRDTSCPLLPPVLLGCVEPRNASSVILPLALASPEMEAGGCVRRGEVLLSPCSFCILSVIWRRIFMESFLLSFSSLLNLSPGFPICKCWGFPKGVVEIVTENVPGLSVPSVLLGLLL